MGKIIPQEKVKLICGVLWNTQTRPEDVLSHAQTVWGKIDFQSPVFDFNFTDYYLDESGPNLKKHYISFEELVNIDDIPALKIAANGIEDAFFSNNSRRSANLDPGYIADAKLVMATTKNLPHRVYIGQNIYADLQMIYKKPSFLPVSWTFADVKQPILIEFFNRVRDRYIEQIRHVRNEN